MRLRAHALHRLIALAVRFLEIDAASLRCTYLQEGEPGPLPNPGSHMAGKDGAEISIRRLLLTPQLESESSGHVHTHDMNVRVLGIHSCHCKPLLSPAPKIALRTALS